jgi:hypothetical protein
MLQHITVREGSTQECAREGVRATSVRPRVAGSGNEQTEENVDLQRLPKAL